MRRSSSRTDETAYPERGWTAGPGWTAGEVIRDGMSHELP
jgi:hypothetical protein